MIIAGILLELQCAVQPNDRIECGYLRITKEECENASCCYNSSVRDVKWCFKSGKTFVLIGFHPPKNSTNMLSHTLFCDHYESFLFV